MSESKPFRVIIIGAGLAGSLLANGLLNKNINFTIYERDPEGSKREGYQIRLGDSALTGFIVCLREDHLNRIVQKLGQSASSGGAAPCLYSTKFDPILDLTSLPSYSRSYAINRVILRSLLVEPVRASGNVVYDKCFASYHIKRDDSSGHESVKVFFTDGKSDECDILIGADGSGSRINKAVGLENLVSLDTHWSFLAKGSLPRDRMNKLPHQLQNGPVLVFSKGVSFFYALYLPSQATDSTSNHVAYDESEASFYWGLNVPRALATAYKSYQDIPNRLEFCLDIIKDWAPEYKDLLSTGQEDEDCSGIYVTPLRASTRPAKDWRQRLEKKAGEEMHEKGHARIWLLGDAIHAMQPNRGMGGNQAMHDCAELLPYLLNLNGTASKGRPPSTEEISLACARYESAMIERAFAWVSKSGGTSMPGWDFDGILGKLISIFSKLLVPLLATFLRRSSAKSWDEQRT